MKENITINSIIRNNFKNLITSLKNEELVKIPDGFNNHILWNFGHIIATQNILCYKLSNNAFSIDESIINRYRKGTKPSKITDVEAEKQMLLKLCDETTQQLNEDFSNKLFQDFIVYETSFGYTLNSIEEAILFNNVHEGMHLGYVMGQKRALGI
jgi:hypothetical protein